MEYVDNRAMRWKYLKCRQGSQARYPAQCLAYHAHHNDTEFYDGALLRGCLFPIRDTPLVAISSQ